MHSTFMPSRASGAIPFDIRSGAAGMASACVVVLQVVFKISLSFVRDSSQQRHNGGPERAPI
jgi:hypothetical protein